MSNFSGRRAPNVSAYLANLNTIPGQDDQIAQPDFSLDDGNLDYLSTAEFFDFDLSAPAPVDFQQHAPQPAQNNVQMTGTSLQCRISLYRDSNTNNQCRPRLPIL